MKSLQGYIVKKGFSSLTIPVGIPIDSFNPKFRFVTQDFIELSHKIDISVYVWTINKKEEMKTLLDWGADGIITDNPKLLKDVIYK